VVLLKTRGKSLYAIDRTTGEIKSSREEESVAKENTTGKNNDAETESIRR
jgi:hypothetical protein